MTGSSKTPWRMDFRAMTNEKSAQAVALWPLLLNRIESMRRFNILQAELFTGT
jgi:hypothetical protein